jgi:hypothetical protein
MGKHFDLGAFIVILVTFILFSLSLLFEGLTHAILLESGVLLVSIKLIIMSYKLKLSEKGLHMKLDTIYDELTRAGLCRPATAKDVES